MDSRSKKGFTLAELLVVVAIIAVLVGVAVPVFKNSTSKAKEAACSANKRNLYAKVMVEYITGDRAEGNCDIAAEDVAAYTCPAGGAFSLHFDSGTHQYSVACSVHDGGGSGGSGGGSGSTPGGGALSSDGKLTLSSGGKSVTIQGVNFSGFGGNNEFDPASGNILLYDDSGAFILAARDDQWKKPNVPAPDGTESLSTYVDRARQQIGEPTDFAFYSVSNDSTVYTSETITSYPDNTLPGGTIYFNGTNFYIAYPGGVSRYNLPDAAGGNSQYWHKL